MTEATTRASEISVSPTKAGSMKSCSSVSPVSIGPGRMKLGRLRAVSHHSSRKASGNPSPMTRSATEAARLEGFIMRREPRLRRLEEIAIAGIDRGDDDDDDGHDQRRVVILARHIEEPAEAGIAAEKLGRQQRLPRHAEADAHGREEERRQRRQDDEKEPLEA